MGQTAVFYRLRNAKEPKNKINNQEAKNLAQVFPTHLDNETPLSWDFIKLSVVPWQFWSLIGVFGEKHGDDANPSLCLITVHVFPLLFPSHVSA